MAVEALCPTCGAVFSLKEEYLGKKVRCKKCEHVFTVAGDKANDRAADDGVRAGTAAAPPMRSARDEDDDDDRRPRKSAVKRGRDDDDDDDNGRAGRKKRKRLYHDDDEDDDKRSRRKAAKGGGSGKILAIIGAIVVVLVLVCSGTIYGIYRLVENSANELNDQLQQAANDAANGDGPGFGGLPGFERQPKDLPEALSYLKSNVAGDKRGAARWLARQPLDNGRRKEVAAALEPLLKDDDASCAAAAAALKVWGTRDNGPALTAALKTKREDGIPGDQHKELMAAIGHVKYEPGADEIMRFLPNFFVGEDAVRALAELGPGAEKTVLKAMNHKDQATRDRARRLLAGYHTKPAAYLDQAVEDLGSAEKDRAKFAAEWLAQPGSDAALTLAKAEPARRTAVAVALNPLIESPPSFFEDTLLTAVRRWGTKDNIPALIHMLTNNPFKKRQAADALIAIGPACEPEVKKLLGHRDGGVVNEAKRILTNVGSTDVKFVAAIEDLKSDEGGRIERAARALQAGSVDEKQRPAVVEALLGTIKDTGVGRGDNPLEQVAKALAVWMKKEDGSLIVDKVKEMHKFFCRKSRKILIEWMGKQKVEQAIPFLTGALVDKDDSEDASRALQAMGPNFGEPIESRVLQLQTNDRNQLLECLRVLGTVGSKKSLPLLQKQLTIALKKKDDVVAKVCAEAIAAIKSR
jgi:predicted Zn finger-like uncharacterized protein